LKTGRISNPSYEKKLAAQKRLQHRLVRARDDVGADQFAVLAGGGGAGVHAARTEPTSPRTNVVTKALPICTCPAKVMFAALHIASVAAIVAM
jgi:hypothetical protein